MDETYTFLADVGPPSCSGGFGRTLGYPVRFLVAAKGEIHFTLAEGAQCVDQEAVRTQTQAFTLTGGTGIYAGASGSGTVERTLGGETATGRIGRETWTGTLSVPGLEFDVTPPTLTGAVGKKMRTPRTARRVRVTYGVSVQDDVDGSVPVSCQSRSGSRFRIGRTVVTCSATDTSGNMRTTSSRSRSFVVDKHVTTTSRAFHGARALHHRPAYSLATIDVAPSRRRRRWPISSTSCARKRNGGVGPSCAAT